MNIDHARTLIARALQTMDHVDGKSKTDKRAMDIVRQLLRSTEQALSESPASATLPIPAGAREGISTVPRSQWRR